MAVRVLFLISILFGVVKGQAMVHDIAVKNADSVTIYYNYINDGKELEVTGQGYIGSVVIPEKVTYQNITRKVTSIEDYALSCCHHLKSVTIPRSVTSIGARAFSGCDRLASISVEVGNKVYESRDNCNAIIETATNTLIVGSNNTIIPGSVTSIGRGAFIYRTGLKSLTIPGSVTSIGNSAFSGCTGLKSVSIDNGVTSIGSSAFSDCSGLKSLTIPGSVTSIGAFAFSHCTGLKSLTIGIGLKSIGYAPFSGCISLTSISVEDGNKVYDSRDNCNAIIESATNTLIAGCKNTVISKSVTSIGESAFDYCTGLKSLTIPRSVTSIGVRAFSGCDRLASISVEDGNKVYDSRDNCNAIIESATNTLIAGCKNTVIPKSVTSIGRGAFSHCNCLTSLTIPKGVTSIGIGAFDYCTRLKSVKIPSSVTSIGAYAFYGCYSLKDVYCYAVNVPTTDSQPDGDWVFCNLGSVKLHVPAASLEAYKTAWPWKVFGKFVELR